MLKSEKTNVWSNSDVQEMIRVIKSDLTSLLQSDVFLIEDKFVAREAALVSRLRRHEALSALSEIIIQSFLQAEQLFPRAGTTLLKAWTMNEDCEWMRDIINAGSDYATSDDLTKLITTCCDHQTIRDVILECLRLAGHVGSIRVESATISKPVIEKTRGHVLHLKSAMGMQLSLNRPHVVVIDGYVESVAEIHSLLEEVHQSGNSLVIFARGYHDEVLNTLSVNLQRKTLNIHPIIVPFDIDGVNVLNDVAVICETDVISSHKGQLVSTLRISDTTIVDDITIYHDRLMIEHHQRNSSNLQCHIQELRRRRNEAPEQLIKIFDERLKSLSSGQVILRLPVKTSPSLRQAIDRMFRAVSNLTTYGIIEVNNERLPAAELMAVIKLLPTLTSRLRQIGSVIII